MLVSSIIISTIIGCSSVFAADENQLGIPLINGNVGINGGGFGDLYGGKVKEGVYGAGGRIGGNLNLAGTAGLGGRKRREAEIKGTDASAGSIASGKDSVSMGGAASNAGSINFNNAGRKRRQAVSGASQSAGSIASAQGSVSMAGAASSTGNITFNNAGRKRRQAVTGASQSAGSIASGANSVSMAGAASGTGSINFGNKVAPAAAGGRRRRHSIN